MRQHRLEGGGRADRVAGLEAERHEGLTLDVGERRPADGQPADLTAASGPGSRMHAPEVRGERGERVEQPEHGVALRWFEQRQRTLHPRPRALRPPPTMVGESDDVVEVGSAGHGLNSTGR